MASNPRIAQALEILHAGGCVRVFDHRDHFGRPVVAARLCRADGGRMIRVPGIGPATLLSDEVRAVLPTLVDKFGFVPGWHRIAAAATV